MSKEEKKAPVKAIAKSQATTKPVRKVPAKHVSAVNVLTTFDVLMDNLRRNHIKKIAYPWEK